MAEFSVNFYKREDGTKPVGEFIKSLELKLRAKVVANLNLLEEYGNKAREPLSKELDDGIFELRVKEGSNIVRILYFFDKERFYQILRVTRKILFEIFIWFFIDFLCNYHILLRNKCS